MNPLPLLLDGLLGRGVRLFEAGWVWLTHRSAIELACIALAILAVVQQLQLGGARSALAAEQAAHNADIARWRAASAAATAKTRAKIEKTVARRRSSDERILHATDDHLAALRSLSARGELRPRAAEGRADRGGAGAGVEAPCRAADPTWLCLSPGDVLRAAENEERHDRLIDAVEAQAAIDPNAAAQPNPPE